MKILHLSKKHTLSLSLIIVLLLTSYSTTFAQYSTSSITFTADSDGELNVFQSIDIDGVTASITVQTFGTNIREIIATDENNNTLLTDVGSDGITIDTLGSEQVNLSYFADGLLTRNGNIWSISFTTIEDVQMILPSGAEVLYISDIPLYENNGIIFMEAGTIEIDYTLHEVATKEFTVNSGTEYVIEISSAADIENFQFIEKDKKLSFTVNRANIPVTLKIPKALLEGPFVALLNGNSITHAEYLSTDTHIWVMMEPNESGRVVLFSGTIPIFHGTADVKVIAKQIRDLILVRITNDKDSEASVYGLTVTIDSGIDAFKGPKDWSRSGASFGPATSSTENDPVLPGNRLVFMIKAQEFGPMIEWQVYDQSENVLEEGIVKPFLFGRGI